MIEVVCIAIGLGLVLAGALALLVVAARMNGPDEITLRPKESIESNTKGGEKGMEPSETNPNVDVEVGDPVIYHDSKGASHNALVTCVHSQAPYFCVNLVIVSDNENERDQYGRQIARPTSVQHATAVGAHGMYWRRSDEAPNAYMEPVSV